MLGGAHGCYPCRVAVNSYQAVKQAMQDLIAPQLESLRGDITAVGASVGALRAEMQSEFKAVRTEMRADMTDLRGEMAEMRGDMQALRAELNGLRGETSANINRLDERLTIAIDVRERIVALEARLAR